MENIKMSHVSLQRILRIASRVNQLDDFEITTLKYLLSQCTDDERVHILDKYGDQLRFLRSIQ